MKAKQLPNGCIKGHGLSTLRNLELFASSLNIAFMASHIQQSKLKKPETNFEFLKKSVVNDFYVEIFEENLKFLHTKTQFNFFTIVQKIFFENIC